MATNGPTWAQCKTQLAETFRKWGMKPAYTQCNLSGRDTLKRIPDKRERRVTIGFYWRARPVEVSCDICERAVDNFLFLCKGLEAFRLAQSNGMVGVWEQIIEQWWEVDAHTPTPPSQEHVASGPHSVLRIAPDAPLEVAEAAYRALSKRAHPDAGGSDQQMQALNAAIVAYRQRVARSTSTATA